MRKRISWLTLSLSILASGFPAQAGLLGSPVTVTLTSPNGIAQSNGTTVAVDPTPVLLSDSFSALTSGLAISAGDSHNIGAFMLPGEQIVFNDASVDVHVASGLADPSTGVLSTGYQAGAAYQFTGFSLPGNEIISSATLSVAMGQVTNFSPSWLTLSSPRSFSLDLADMNFVPLAGQSTAGADFTIALAFAAAPVPEPPGVALLLAGLAVLWVARRRWPAVR